MFIKEKQKFNVILEDGCAYLGVYIKCNKGFIRDKRDLNNALKWEKQVKVITESNYFWINNKQIYEVEEVKKVFLPTLDIKTNKKIIMFIAPSGAGKTKSTMILRSYGIPELISHTDREIRANDNEINGVSYYFVSKEEFKNTELVESATYSGNSYGLSVKEVESKLAKYDYVYAITEINGVKKIKERYGDMVSIVFIKIDPEVAYQRMIKRGDNEKKIKERMENAIINKEYENWKYADFIIDNNGTQEETEKQLLNVVQKIIGKPLRKNSLKQIS